MRKWSPDTFAAPRNPVTPDFEPWPAPAIDPVAPATATLDQQAVEEETRAEDGRAELEWRLRELERDHLQRLAEARQQFEAGLEAWRQSQADLRERDVRRLADAAVDLAVAMADKIVRTTVRTDRGVLLRTLETALFKLRDDRSVNVHVHPDDAVWLEADEKTRSRLRIAAVVPDRRVEIGGCRLVAGDEEWDATLTAQLGSLAALVEGALREPDTPEDPGEGP